MAANKFATILNINNTNKITLVLVYAILEWVLILLLFLNSILSHLIIKFSDYFGLKRPCLLCSRLDHLFEAKNLQSSYRSLVCEAHAIEISQLGYCFNHKRLAESLAMCGDCLYNSNGKEPGSGKVALFPWMELLGVAQVSEKNGGLCFKCSCCGASLEEEEEKKLFFQDDHFANDFWQGLGDTNEGNSVLKCEVGDKVDEEEVVNETMPSFMSDRFRKDERVEEAEEATGLCFGSGSLEMVVGDCIAVVSCVEEEKEAVDPNLDAGVDDHAANSDTAMQVGEERYCESQPQHLEFFIDQVDFPLTPIETVRSGNTKQHEVFVEHKKNEIEDFLVEFDEDVGAQYELVVEEEEDFEEAVPLLLHHEFEKQTRADERLLVDNLGPDSTEMGIEQVAMSQATQMQTTGEDDAHASYQNTEADFSIGTEIPEQEPVDDLIREAFSTRYAAYNDLVVCDEPEEHPVEFRTEESLDGSIISDIDAGDAVSMVEKLKSALIAERKMLHELYSELEEERNASAVAASQTMAMINRLQEEKAAMQMEALQYQRMMDEQSEYDQDTLQLLNELVLKREREKDELEKEMEIYRKKVHDYESRERKMMLRRRQKSNSSSGSPTGSCTNSEDIDEHLVDDHREGSNQNTPVDAVLYLEESLANFEDERLSILEQLKTLDDKLFTLSDKDEHRFKDGKSIERLCEANENGYHEKCDHNGEANGIPNGNHHLERKNIGAKAKRLLPLFDAVDLEGQNGILNGHSEMEDGKRLAIEEEVDRVYERLQAFEADREFVRHCVSSMRKGDKGVELLQDILQHLCHLQSVELNPRSNGDEESANPRPMRICCSIIQDPMRFQVVDDTSSRQQPP